MTPAQARAALQKAQREITAHNQKVKKAVARYNQEVRAYNSSARAHNRQVENQRQRLNQEIRRLNQRPASTTFVTYQASTATLVQRYNTAEVNLTSNSASPAARRFVDLAGDEAANSVYLINALNGDGDPADDPTEDELRAPSLANELSAFGQDLVNRWAGALFSLSPQNPDAARHFCTSAREVLITMLDSSAPDAEVKHADPACEATDKGVPTRRAKINYLLRKHGVTDRDIVSLVDENVSNVLTLFRTFNNGTHGHAGRFTITELASIRTRVEAAISFIHQVVAAPTS
ncbi:hypothetical protein [Amycolatopsis sp. lyj-84]|uniref:pPIWI-associating nuclease domain-containing protein n=1 Tax=Amycolatopsis sp. lyj-84 TaxID=2789284 RepID=UPI00397A16D2